MGALWRALAYWTTENIPCGLEVADFPGSAARGGHVACELPQAHSSDFWGCGLTRPRAEKPKETVMGLSIVGNSLNGLSNEALQKDVLLNESVRCSWTGNAGGPEGGYRGIIRGALDGLFSRLTPLS